MSALFWRCLEDVPGLKAVPSVWRGGLRAEFDAVRSTFLRDTGERAQSIPCPRECGCAHRIVSGDGKNSLAVCQCESWSCEDIVLPADETSILELNWTKLGRAVARALACDARDADMHLPFTRQVASFSNEAVPVIITVQCGREEFRNVVNALVARLRRPFALLSPTARFHDAHVEQALAHNRAQCFALESQLLLRSHGAFQAKKSGGELFSMLLPERAEALEEGTARSLFALVKQLDSENPVRKAPVIQVFRLYCVEGLSRAQVAKRCGCVESLITLRLQQIEKKLGRRPSELRTFSTQFEQMEESLRDDRARTIYRREAADFDHDGIEDR